MNHTETQTGYGVLVTRKDGTKFLASGNDGRFFRCRYSRSKAVAWKNELVNHLKCKCKVVRIKATWEVVE